jgi:hypothetical protein
MTRVGVAIAVASCRGADRGRPGCADSGASEASVVRHEGARRRTLLRVPRVAPSDRRESRPGTSPRAANPTRASLAGCLRELRVFDCEPVRVQLASGGVDAGPSSVLTAEGSWSGCS